MEARLTRFCLGQKKQNAMNAIKKTIAVLFLAAIPFLSSAQKSKIPQRNEIITVTSGEEGVEETLEVFNMPEGDKNNYFLSVGHLGFGDEVVQVLFDPIFELFIPLGETLEEAQETLLKLQALYKEAPGTSIETEGCLAFGFPTEKRETVKVTYRKRLLSKQLEFTLEREGYIRSAYVNKSDFGAIVSGVKFYRKIHPKQK